MIVLTIYKNLNNERLCQLLDKFKLNHNSRKSCKVNDVTVFAHTIDVQKDCIYFYNEDEYYNRTSLDYDIYAYDIAMVAIVENQLFDLVVEDEWFNIKLK